MKDICAKCSSRSGNMCLQYYNSCDIVGHLCEPDDEEEVVVTRSKNKDINMPDGWTIYRDDEFQIFHLDAPGGDPVSIHGTLAAAIYQYGQEMVANHRRQEEPVKPVNPNDTPYALGA